MKVLLVKMSSLGDVIHTLPALTDAANIMPDIQFDWLVEEAFMEIARMHPAVGNVIPIALRRWRKNIIKSIFSSEFRNSIKRIRQEKYDVIIDAQGLLKSNIVTWLARGKDKHGLHRAYARGKLDFAYHHKHKIVVGQHAIVRVRQLFAESLGYGMPVTPIDYGIAQHIVPTQPPTAPYIVLIHGTTWPSKRWPEPYWQQLVSLLTQQGWHVLLPAGNDAERERAQRICQQVDKATVIPPTSLQALTNTISGADALVTVDTGLAHLAAALHKPCIAIYGSTSPAMTGVCGGADQEIMAADFPCAPCLNRDCTHPDRHQTITPPCYQQISPQHVVEKLNILLSTTAT